MNIISQNKNFSEHLSHFAECEDGKYGGNCKLSCRRCKDDEACDKKTGKCPKGCPPGLLGDLCDQRE